MTYKSKRAITTMAASILLLIVYLIYTAGKSSDLSENLMSWARMLLTFIGIAVVTQIAIQIIFHIVVSIGIAVKNRGDDENEIERILAVSAYEDEMDKLIGLKSARLGYICMSAGVLAGLVALAAGMMAIVALNLIVGAIFAGTIIEGCASVIFYERGFGNG